MFRFARTRNRTLAAVGLLVLMAAGPAMALPSDQTITFNIRVDPQDDQSAIKFSVALNAHPVLQIANTSTIGWAITQIEIRQKHSGSSDSVWRETWSIDTDNLWYVTHANANSPVASEFTDTPALSGTAAVISNATDDLDFSFDGNPSQSTMFSGNVSDTTYSFIVHTPQEPIDDGSDEPEEVGASQ